MDLKKIEEASARNAERLAAERGYDGKAQDDREALIAAVPDLLTDRATLLAEIERLKTLAREGWQAARDAWETEDFGDAVRISAALTEIGSPPARPVETIDLRVEGADALREAGETIAALREDWAEHKAMIDRLRGGIAVARKALDEGRTERAGLALEAL